MSADDFLWLVTQAVFLAVFLDVSIEAIRRPRLAHFDIALFFGAIGAIIAVRAASFVRRLAVASAVAASRARFPCSATLTSTSLSS